MPCTEPKREKGITFNLVVSFMQIILGKDIFIKRGIGRRGGWWVGIMFHHTHNRHMELVPRWAVWGGVRDIKAHNNLSG